MKKYLLLVAWLATIAVSIPSLAASQSKRKMKKIMESWMDQPKNKLYLSWGPPTRETSDGNGGEILVYSNRVYMRGYYWMGNYIQGVDYYVHKIFYVNKDGTIYAYRWEKNPNPPDRIDVELFVH